MPQPDSDQFLVFPPADTNKIPNYKQVIPVSVYHFYIIDEIGETAPFLDLINTLKTAEEHDSIFIYLNTPGGSLQTTVQILGAMRQSSANVVTSLEGEVCSAGTLIFLAGDKHIVNPNCTFMIHNYSQWVGGKGNEIASRVKYFEEYFRTLANDIYGGFLTPQEIDLMMDGKDYWMNSEMVIERLKIRNDLLDAIVESVNSISSENVNAFAETIVPDEIPIVNKKSRKK